MKFFQGFLIASHMIEQYKYRNAIPAHFKPPTLSLEVKMEAGGQFGGQNGGRFLTAEICMMYVDSEQLNGAKSIFWVKCKI